jgi:hypothetical protein
MADIVTRLAESAGAGEGGKPKRIQRSRAKGWRMPAGAVYVGRPTRWGNPFVAYDWRAAFRAVAIVGRGDRSAMRQAAVALYRMWLTATWGEVAEDKREWFEREVMTVKVPPDMPTVEEIRAELRGKNLACWCPLDQPCHADVLLEIANAEDDRR